MSKYRILLSFVLVTGLFFTSCENEPIGTADVNLDIVDEELFSYLTQISDETEIDNEANCIEFNYSFTVFIFDVDMNFSEAVAVFNNGDMSALLNGLEPNESISLNYPIAGTLDNGELIEIETNEELKQAIAACSKEKKRRRCNNTLIDCVWKVNPISGSPNDFEGSTFKVNRNGTVQFHYGSDVYFGTWVTLYIGDDLFLNIDLNDSEIVEGFWDRNWEVALLTDTQIGIYGNGEVLLEKDCNNPCTEAGYQVCELEDAPGFANFNLAAYTTCIPVPATHDIVSAVTYSFFETEEDALNNTNPISSIAYTNIVNPQPIFVRIDYLNTAENLAITEITIEAVPCPGG
ncbi:MAG TPA: hypothetical protein EYN07_09630 [Flavobacteriaceae bacterium]|nr:hypothetical protein [Flavobacteriaceae bacterium]HIN99487.1 hypothetical protein [Flavobacteriaceae bacterium]